MEEPGVAAHPPGLAGCGRVLIAAGWTVPVALFHLLAVAVLAGVAPQDVRGASGAAVFAFFTLFLLPFDAIAVGLWRPVVRAWLDPRRPTGHARVTAHPAGWRATFPDDARLLAAGAVLIGLPVALSFALPVWYDMRCPPAGVTGGAVALALALAAAAYRTVRRPHDLIADDDGRTLTLPLDGGRARTVPFAAVRSVGVTDSDPLAPPWHQVVVRLRDGSAVTLPGTERRAAAERFAAWLRARVAPRPADEC